MSENAGPGTMEAPGENTPDRPIDPVLLNALADVTAEGPARVVTDQASRTFLADVVSNVTSQAERERFRSAVETVRTEGEGSADARAAVGQVVDAVREALRAHQARVIVDHQTPLSLEAGEVAVYNFVHSRDPDDLADLDLPAPVRDPVRTGAARVAEGAYADAAAAFERATDAAGVGSGAVVSRTLAGWAHHWAGRDDTAIDFVEEALHLHADAWAPTLVGFSADPDPSFARPEQFREGKYAAMAVLRYTIDRPDGTSLTPALGLGADDGIDTWTELEGPDECTRITRLAPKSVLRLRLSGEVPAFPAVHSYYVGLGIVDREVEELREVYRLFVNGPSGDQVTETVRIEQ